MLAIFLNRVHSKQWLETYHRTPKRWTTFVRGIGNMITRIHASALESMEETEPMPGFMGDCFPFPEAREERAAGDRTEVGDYSVAPERVLVPVLERKIPGFTCQTRKENRMHQMGMNLRVTEEIEVESG